MTQAVKLAQLGSPGISTGFKNRIINGAMMIDQRNAGASGTSNSTYTVDRFAYYGSQASKVTWQQNQGSVTPPAGFTNYFGFTSSSSYASLSTDAFQFYQSIEAFNTADLNFGTANAKTITLSFWVRSSLTGTFGGALSNSGNSRCYPFTYTISSANTWEQKSITVAGDTTGTWLGASNGVGIAVNFDLGSGSNYQGTAGSWVSANKITATGSTSVVSTNGATFYITGVQLEVGTTATDFDYRPYGTELALCQRYYYGDFQSVGGVCYGANDAVMMPRFIVPMRATPTLSFKTGSTVSIDIYGIGTASRSISFSDSFTAYGCRISFSVSGATMGNPCHITSNQLQVSAEL